MGTIVLTSAAGAPGVTSTAVGLALCWPRSVLLIDVDPAASQAVLAGYLGGRGVSGKGLVRVAEAHRERRALREAVLDQCIELADTAPAADPVRRLFLPGFTRGGNAALFGTVWPDLAETLARLDEVEIDVIVDLGRMEGRGVPVPLLESGARVALTTRTSLRSVAAARTAAAVLTDQSRLGAAEPPGLLLVAAGRPYGAREIGAALGMRVLGEVAYDPVPAAVLSDGAPRPRGFDRSPLVRSLHQLADAWSAHWRRAAPEPALADEAHS